MPCHISNSKPSRSAALMLRACARGDLLTVQRLIAKRGAAMLQVHGTDGCTPLLLACKKGHKAVAEYLLANGAKITDTDRDMKRQGCALHYAAWGGHIELVRWLVDDIAAPLGQVDIVGNTPLLYSVYGGHRLVVEFFTARGRSLRERNNKNHTVILQAACGGHLHLVKWLLEKGFSLQETDNDGNTALLFAAWGGHRELMEFLLTCGSQLHEKNHNGHSVFLSAANGGRVEVVEWLLAQGFSLHETNNNGDTALLLAAYGGHRHLVQRLLELGASLEDKNGCGFTPLLSAANGGQLEMAKWLLARGSSIREADNDGYTSLILAACGGNIDLVRFFLENGASLKERNNNGDTALLLAAYCGHRELVEWLVDHGSALDEKNNTGMGVLISAANGRHLDVVQVVLERLGGHGLENTDEGGYTPFLLAAQRGHFPVVRHLAAHGANIRARTTRHDNDAIALSVDCPEVQEYVRHIWDMAPLQIACEAKMTDRVHVLLRAGVNPLGFPAESAPLRLALTASTTYPSAPEPSEELARLLRMAVLPWFPASTGLFGSQFRRTLFTVLLVKNRLERESALPFLPTEIWLHIMSFVGRSWFEPEAIAPGSLVVSPAPKQHAMRTAWRRKRLLNLPEAVEVPAMECDEDDFLELRASELDLIHRKPSHKNIEGNEQQAGRVTPVAHYDAVVSMDEEADAKVFQHDPSAEEVSAATATSSSSSPSHFRITWV
jgi:ankyrin repeat protein